MSINQVIFLGVVAAVVVAIVMGGVAMVKAGNAEWERNENAFRAECVAVGGRPVWNNKYWECLK
jgi:cell division protein FtsN